MNVPADIIAFLKEREGFETKSYLDSRELPTAGMGHLLTKEDRALLGIHFDEESKKWVGIGGDVSPEQCDVWAQQDSMRAYTASLSQCATLRVWDANFIKVLTSVNFQLGTGWALKFPRTWSLLLNKEYDQAAAEVQKSEWFKQTPTRVQDFQQAILGLKNQSNQQS